MTLLSAVLLSDGKPGHYRCAEAILDAIRAERPVEVHRIEVRRSRLVPPFVLWRMSERKIPPRVVLKYVYGVDPAHLGAPDLIVSAGGDTLAANVALARLTGAANIFFGSLRRFDPRGFTLTLNSYTTEDAAPNQLRILKPSPADPTKLPVPDLDHRRLPKVAGLLVGGPSGDARFETRDWAQLFALLRETRQQLGIRWVVSNSRRTPAAASDELAALAAEAGGPVLRFIDVRDAGPGTLGALFEESGAVVVTADSSAMISEAVWMRRPTLVVAPALLQLPPKEVEYRRWLEGLGLCREIALADVTPESFASSLRQITPLTINPLAELTDILRGKLPGLF